MIPTIELGSLIERFSTITILSFLLDIYPFLQEGYFYRTTTLLYYHFTPLLSFRFGFILIFYFELYTLFVDSLYNVYFFTGYFRGFS